MKSKVSFEESISGDSKVAVIKVVGVGGAGGNAINRMVKAGVKGIELIAMNTDAQVLRKSLAPVRLQIGTKLAKGKGVGGNPVLGRQAAEESRASIKNELLGADMVFVTAGMGKGTGTGASPLVAEIAQSLNALTVGVVTTPFEFEGHMRAEQAEEGIKELRQFVDTLLLIKNERLFHVTDKTTPLEDAFRMADEVLHQGIQAISDVITTTGDVNVDFADVTTIMRGAGEALMGIGEGEGANRTMDAVNRALRSPLLMDVSIEGAKGVLVNFTSGQDFTLQEIKDPMKMIENVVSRDAKVFLGHVTELSLHNRVRVTMIVTGFLPQNRTLKGDKKHRTAEKTTDEDFNIPAYKRRECRILK